MNIYKAIFLVQMIYILVGCAGNPPSITNFMDDAFLRSAQVNIWNGDLISEDADTIEGPYIFERPVNLSHGIYFGDTLRIGIELGLSGLNAIIGIKNDYFGVLSWANINGNSTGGIAIAQQTMLSDYNSIGVFEYLSKNSIAKYDQTELGRSQNGSITYGEYGVGLYLRQKIYEKINLSIETKYGNQIESNGNRYYLGINVDYK